MTGTSRRLLALLPLAILLLAVACTTDKERISDANEDARQSESIKVPETFDPDKLTGEISIFDVRDGDCFNSSSSTAGGGLVEFDKITLVSCDGDWQFRTLNTFLTEAAEGNYPGEAFFDQEFLDRCHRLTTFFVFPTSESWDVGDRVINCIQEGTNQ